VQLAHKITSFASAGVVLATAGAIGSVYMISHRNRVNELRSIMSSTIRQAETVTANMNELHAKGAFNTGGLARGLAASGANYRESAFYKSIPVVAGWQSVSRVAQNERFHFPHAIASGRDATKPSEPRRRIRRCVPGIRRRSKRILRPRSVYQHPDSGATRETG